MVRVNAVLMFALILGANVAAADAPKCQQDQDCAGSGITCRGGYCLQQGECVTGEEHCEINEFCAAGRCVPCGELNRCYEPEEPSTPPPPPKPKGPPKAKYCWDTFKINNKGDLPEEDLNGDGKVDMFDCHGKDGIDGKGVDGAPGLNGFHCWDLNMNGQNDPFEDLNGDGAFTTEDCQGAPCWDTNGNRKRDPEEDRNGDGKFDTDDCRVDLEIYASVGGTYKAIGEEANLLGVDIAIHLRYEDFLFSLEGYMEFGDWNPEEFWNAGGFIAEFGGRIINGLYISALFRWYQSAYDPNALFQDHSLEIGARIGIQPWAIGKDKPAGLDKLFEITADFTVGPHAGREDSFADAPWLPVFMIQARFNIPIYSTW